MRFYLSTVLCVVLVFAVPSFAQSPAATTTQLSVGPANSVTAGTLLTLTANVSTTGIVNRGTVNFCLSSSSYCDRNTSLGSAQVNNVGSATLKLRLGVGKYSIKAVYVGTTSYLSSTTTPQTVTVTGNQSLSSSTSLTAAGTIGNYTLSGTVAGFGNSLLNGSISFFDTTLSNLQIGSASLLTPIRTFASSSTFAAPRGSQWGRLALGDFNGDGFTDLVAVSETDGFLGVYTGNSNGTLNPFVPPLPGEGYQVGSNADAIAVGDFNGDGILDVVAFNQLDGTVAVLIGNGDGTFQTAIGGTSGGRGPVITVGDFNLDGCLDVAATDNNLVAISLGDCTGNLRAAQSFTTDGMPSGVIAADFNSDGKVDIAVVNQSTNDISVLLGNGDGTFQVQQLYAVGASPSSIAVTDFNLDGKPDLAVANQSDNTVSVLLGNGDGSFQAQQVFPVGTSPSSVAVIDFNSDGKPDLAVANQGSNNMSVLLGNGDGTFQAQELFALASGPTSLAFADVNGDGLPDLVSANSGRFSLMLGGQVANYSSTGISVAGVAGTHQVLAQYSGDAGRAPSNSALVALSAASSPASMSLTTSSNPSIFGDTLVFTATLTGINGVTPTGTVSFTSDGVAIGTAQIDASGIASISIDTLTGGSHSIVAIYSGDENFF